MNRKFLHIFILFFLFVAILPAQSEKKIYGYIYDSLSQQPLLGANIVVDGTGLGTASDGNGYFGFENLFTGNYSLIVSYVGYKTKRIDNISVMIDQPAEINIYLVPNSSVLNDVVITGNINSKFSANVKVLSQKDIEKQNSNSVGELLQLIPGIEIIKTGTAGSSQKVSIRGSNTNQVIVMLDGVPLNNQFGGSADLSKIPTNVIEKIEIYQGGSSSRFGSGAIGGAINIITKRNFKNEYKIDLTVGSYNYYNVVPTISGGYGNLSYIVSYNYVNSAGNYPYNYINTYGNETKANRINADIVSKNIYARINYNKNNFSFSINGQHLNAERGLPGPASALSVYARSKNKSQIAGLNIKGTFNNFVLDINGGYSENVTENINFFPENNLNQNLYYQYHYKYQTDIANINTSFYYTYNNFLFITGGYSGKFLYYNDKDLLHDFSVINNATDFSNGFFFHPKLNILLPEPFNNLALIPALRYDEMRLLSKNSEHYENQWSPSFALYLSAGKKNKIYFNSSIAKSFRVPTFSDLFYQDVRIKGKADLLPEKSLNKEIGIGWEINFYGKFSGKINYYAYTIEDMIVWKLGSFEIFRPFNEDAEITGQEYSLKYKFSEINLELGTTYTHLKPLNKNKDKTTFNKIIPYKPQHSVKSNLHYGYKNFSVNISHRFISTRFVTVANTVELPYYNLFDLTMLQTINAYNVKTVIKFSIMNITNENYEIIRDYPVPGRELKIGLTLTY